MPLTPAYTWSETESVVRITIDGVPIKDQSQLFCSDRLVKLNAPPYLLLLDLKAPVDDDRSTATVLHGRKIVFQLTKAEPGLWGRLTAQGDKCAIKQQREESVRQAHEKQVAAQQQRLARKQQEEKAAIDRQIAQERAQHERVEQLKQQELQQERQQLQQWQHALPCSQQQQQQPCGGDESDYEDDLAAEEELAVAAAAAAADGLQVGGSQDAMPDHPNYHGRGWKTSTAAAAAEEAGAAGVRELDQQQQQMGRPKQSSSISSINQGSSDMEAAASEPEVISLTAAAAVGANPAATVMEALLSDAAAAAAGQHCKGDASSGGGSSSSVEAAACSIWGPDSGTPAAAADRNDKLLTVRSSSCNAAAPPPPPPAAAAAAGSARSALPAKPPAPVRSQMVPVAVRFTQLSTPHLPAREQREVELKSIKRHAKADSLDVSERQPAFLKDKGDALAAQGNYSGAINAYTRALELQPSQPSLWSNRAACHLELGQAAECMQDCTTAVDLLQAAQAQLLQAAGQPGAEQELLVGLLPAAGASAADIGGAGSAEERTAELAEARAGSGAEKGEQQQQEQASHAGNAAEQPDGSSSNRGGSSSSSGAALKLQRQLAKALVRRAAAHVELQQLQEAWDDLQQALRYEPSNAQLQVDALELSAVLNPDAGAAPSSLKQRADARFTAGDVEGAAEAYTALVQLLLQHEQQHPPSSAAVQQEQEQQQEGAVQLLAVLSNRAACWLSLEQYTKCIEDCQAALALALAESQPSAERDVVAGAATAADAAGSSAAPSTAAAAAPAMAICRIGQEALAAAQPLPQEGPGIAAGEGLLQLLQQRQPELLLALPGVGTARVRLAARLLSRLAVAHGCLKEVQQAVQLYGWAQRWWAAAGDEQRAAEITADQARLQQLLLQVTCSPRDGHATHCPQGALARQCTLPQE